MSEITVCLSLGNFASYCALPGALALIDEFDLSSQWRALPPANRPVTPSPQDDDPLKDYKLRRKRARDMWADREFQRDCERLRLDPGTTPRSVEAGAADMALQCIADSRGDVRAFVEAAFRRAFVDASPVAATSDIADLVDVPGFDSFAQGSGPARLDEVETELGEAGIYAAPAFIVEGEVFQGRQHFPLMRWMLSGRRGPAPV